MGWLLKLERALMVLGVLMLALYVAARIHGAVLARAELHSFKMGQLALATHDPGNTATAGPPDFTLWSAQRIRDYEESLSGHFASAIAVLRIPRIHVEVPVLEGTDDLSLNRGVGHVAGTANPGESGNVAIAGHRDGFFRALKEVRLGDSIEVDALGRTEIYTIERISIVDPSDVSVLKAGPQRSLTLITCYPFYFVGSAPKRYIVQAYVADSAPSNPHAVGPHHAEPNSEQQAKSKVNHFE